MSTAAQQLVSWIERTHPDFFDVLYQHVQKRRQASVLSKARLRGFGDDGIDLSDVSFDVPDTTDFIPELQSVDLDSVDVSTPDIGSALDTTTDSSGTGFLQSIGSGISSAASNVASFLTSAQGLSDLTKLGTAYFGLQNSKANAQLQTQILQAQVTRAATGQSPVPVSYALVNGQLTPVYQSNALPVTTTGALIAPGNMPSALIGAITTGQSQLVTLPNGTTAYTVPSSIAGSLGLSGMTGNLSQLLPLLLVLGGGLLLAKALRH